MGERARLVKIEHDREITKEADSRFLFEYQRAILLALKADGLLDEPRYHVAEEQLRRQMQGYVRDQKGRGMLYDKGRVLLPGVHGPGGPGEFL